MDEEKMDSLVLEISRQDSNLVMSVFEQKELVSTVRDYSQRSISSQEVNRLCQEIISILNKTNRSGKLETDLVDGLKKTGQVLWGHLFTREVKERLKEGSFKNLILSLDEGLIHIPWELLYDGSDFLCLRFNLGRVVRTKGQGNQPQYRSSQAVPRMLILANPTNDLKSSYLEGVFIKNQFDKKIKEIHINFKSTYIDTFYVKKNLRDYDIVHFAGHCEHDSDNPENSGWLLSDGRFTIPDIYALGESLSLPALLFSNSCYSAQGYTAGKVASSYQENSYTLATAFLFSGVRHYIGTIRKIEDLMSLAFAREFYTQLISGKCVGECVRLGRQRLIKEYDISAISWTSYLLYGDPGFILFKAKTKTGPAKPRVNAPLLKKQIKRVCLITAAISLGIYLYVWLPTINPSTYALFLKSRRLFAQGRNSEVVALSSRIIEKEPAFLKAYPLLADAYHKLGKYDLALKYYFEYAGYSEKINNRNNMARAYTGIGWIYHLRGEYPKAFDFYQKALSISRENNDVLNKATALRRLAEWHIDKKEYDKALELLTKSSEINRERQYIHRHRYNLACDYFDLGLVFVNKDDFAAAKGFYEKSRVLFEKLRLENELSDCYFNIGEIYLFHKQYQKAMDSYTAGLKIDQLHGNKLNLPGDYIMIGELYMEMDNLAEAEEFFNKSISSGEEINAPVERASAYYNLGLLYKKQNRKNKAREFLRLAQEIYHSIDISIYREIKQLLLELSNG